MYLCTKLKQVDLIWILLTLPTSLQTGEGCEDIYLYILSAEGMII